MTCITVSHLTKRFGPQTVVDDVSFVLEPHTSTALIGPNGAGKTTTLSMLAGLLDATNGHEKMVVKRDFIHQIFMIMPMQSAQ